MNIFRLLTAPASALLLEKLLKLVTGAILTLLLARHLGPAGLGLYAIVMLGSTALLAVTSLGLQNIVLRQLLLQATPLSSMQLLQTAVNARLFAGVIFAFIAIAGLYLFTPQQPDYQLGLAIAMLWLLQASNAFLLLESYLNYHGIYRRLAYCKTLVIFLFFLLKAGLVYSGYQLVTVIWLTALETLLLALIPLLFYRQLGSDFVTQDIAWLPYHWRNLLPLQLKRLMPKALWLWLSGILAIVYLKIDLLMLGWLAGTEATGYYAAAARVSELWYVLPATLATRYYPALLQAFSKGEAGYYRLLRQHCLRFIGLALAVALLTTLAAPWLLPWLFGATFSPAVSVLQIHIWACMFIFTRYLVSLHLLIVEQEKFSLLSHGIAALLNVALNFLLIPRYGINGAAVATLVAVAFSSVGFLWCSRALRRQLQLFWRS